MVNETIQTICARSSVRSYNSEKPVEQEKLESILRAGLAAPTAGGIEPWKIYVVQDKEKRIALANSSTISRDTVFIQQAPVLLVVCGYPAQSASKYASRGENLYIIQDTAAMTENILIAATSLGLSTCWIGSFVDEKVKSILNCPEGLKPMSIICLGYTDMQDPKPRKIKPIDTYVEYM